MATRVVVFAPSALRRTTDMTNKAEQALNVIQQHIGDLDENGAICVINHIMSELNIDLSKMMFWDSEEVV